jgi:hypothetical protein
MYVRLFILLLAVSFALPAMAGDENPFVPAFKDFNIIQDQYQNLPRDCGADTRNKVAEKLALASKGLLKMAYEDTTAEGADLAILAGLQGLSQAGKDQEMLEAAAAALALPMMQTPKNALVVLGLMVTSFRRTGDRKSQMAVLEKIVKTYPELKESERALRDLVMLSEMEGLYGKTIKYAVMYESRYPNGKSVVTVMGIRALSYLRLGQFNEAEETTEAFEKRFGADRKHDELVFSLRKGMGDYARMKKMHSRARKHYRAMVQHFDKAGLKRDPDSVEAGLVAEAAFRLTDHAYFACLKRNIPSGNPRVMQSSIKELMKTMQIVGKKLDEVAGYKNIYWNIASHYRQGMLWMHLARVVAEAPAPHTLDGPGQAIFKEELRKFVVRFAAEAKRSWSKGLELAGKNEIEGEWVDKIKHEREKLRSK